MRHELIITNYNENDTCDAECSCGEWEGEQFEDEDKAFYSHDRHLADTQFEEVGW